MWKTLTLWAHTKYFKNSIKFHLIFDNFLAVNFHSQSFFLLGDWMIVSDHVMTSHVWGHQLIYKLGDLLTLDDEMAKTKSSDNDTCYLFQMNKSISRTLLIHFRL